MKTKICTQCKIEKQIIEFCKKKSNKDGYCSWCKDCIKLSYIENREIIVARTCHCCGDIMLSNRKIICDNCIKRKRKQYYLDNKDELDERNKAWYRDNKEAKQTYDKEYSHSEKGKTIRKRANKTYGNTKKGKLSNRKKSSRRRKGFTIFQELFLNPFPREIEVNYHHINDVLVIPIPRITHEHCYTGQDISKHREKCKEWIMKLYGLDLDIIMRERMYKEI